jgi:Uma2 family endonuclease
MSALPVAKVTYADYLELERNSDEKHEYYGGEIFAMAGGTSEHARLAMGFGGELRNALNRANKPCSVFTSDLRIRVDETDRTFYPDLSVICGKRQVSIDDTLALTNPVVIVEVLSESTERNDRGEKFRQYRLLPSLEEYVLVNTDSKHIEVFRRTSEGWVLNDARAGEELVLRSLDVRIAVDAIYFDPTAE